MFEPRQPIGFLTILANVVSLVFHPMLLTVYAFLFVNACYPFLFAHLTKLEKAQLIVSLIVNTIAFPFITVFLLKQLGFVKSIALKTREERIIPYIAMSTFYFWTFMVVRNQAIGDLFTHIMLGAALSVFGAFFLNNFYKISIHAVGAGGFVAIALIITMASNYNLTPVLLLVILAAGLVGTSRLYLKAHAQRDIYSGYMIGILAQLIAFIFF